MKKKVEKIDTKKPKTLSYDEELFEISLKNNFSETMSMARKLDKKIFDKF